MNRRRVYIVIRSDGWILRPDVILACPSRRHIPRRRAAVRSVGIDRPDDDAERPPDGRADRQDDQAGGAGRPARHGGGQAETRLRQECYADLRVAESVEKSVTAQQAAAREQAAAEKWGVTAKESRWMWAEYQRRWPPEERAPVDRSGDPPGSWRGEGDRFLDSAKNNQVEAACDRIAKLEEEKITPALRAIESQEPDRQLIGFDDRLKGRDRIKEKVYGMIKESNFSPEQAVSLVPDAIRYTFQYWEARYTQGVLADIARLKDKGFKLDKLKNSWSDDQYKGINSQWIEPDTGQRLEVQFHTRVSFEAKQLTHTAYERLRSQQADAFEELVLEAFQKKVTADVPVPPSADCIPDYPKRGTDAR